MVPWLICMNWSVGSCFRIMKPAFKYSVTGPNQVLFILENDMNIQMSYLATWIQYCNIIPVNRNVKRKGIISKISNINDNTII